MFKWSFITILNITDSISTAMSIFVNTCILMIMIIIILIIFLKCIVHPKMTVLSSFTRPHVVPTLYDFLCSVKHEIKYFEECNQTVLLSVEFYYMDEKYNRICGNRICLFFKIYLCYAKKKVIQVWNNMRVNI